jgi:hypothetical protein
VIRALDHFRRENAHGAVVGGEGLVELSHAAADARFLLNQVDSATHIGEIDGRLDACNASANDQYGFVCQFGYLLLALLGAWISRMIKALAGCHGLAEGRLQNEARLREFLYHFGYNNVLIIRFEARSVKRKLKIIRGTFQWLII